MGKTLKDRPERLQDREKRRERHPVPYRRDNRHILDDEYDEDDEFGKDDYIATPFCVLYDMVVPSTYKPGLMF